MCDLYCGNCKVCGKDLPIHLGDWSTKRDEVEFFCGSHIPATDVRIFILTEEDDEYPVGWKMGMRSLTENAKENIGKNFPNLAANWKTENL